MKRKILSTILTVLFVCQLAGCGNEGANDMGTKDTTEQTIATDFEEAESAGNTSMNDAEEQNQEADSKQTESKEYIDSDGKFKLVSFEDYIRHTETRDITELFGTTTPIDINDFDSELKYFWKSNCNTMSLYMREVGNLSREEFRLLTLSEILQFREQASAASEYVDKYGIIKNVELNAAPEEDSIYDDMDITIIYPTEENGFSSTQYNIMIGEHGNLEEVLGLGNDDIEVYNNSTGEYPLTDAILDKLGEPTSIYSDGVPTLDELYETAQAEGMGIGVGFYTMVYERPEYVIAITQSYAARIDKDGTGFINQPGKPDAWLNYYTKEYWESGKNSEYGNIAHLLQEKVSY